MQVINNDRILPFDVDDTLICWSCDPNTPDVHLISIVDPYDGQTFWVRKHMPHIKLLKNHLARGTQVIVWSQGGYEWAHTVLKALGFSDNDNIIVMSKPQSYVDDLPIQEWAKDRIFISPDSKWGKGIKNG